MDVVMEGVTREGVVRDGVVRDGVVREGVTRAEVPVNGLAEGDVIESVGIVGIGATNAALTPKLPSSIDPSGIPVLVADPMAVGDITGAPEDKVLEAIELQLLNTVVGVGSADEVPPMDMVPDEVPPMDVVPLRPRHRNWKKWKSLPSFRDWMCRCRNTLCCPGS